MSGLDFSPENLRKRYAELEKKRDPIRQEREELGDQLDAAVEGLDGKGKDLTVKEARKVEEKIRPRIRELQQQLTPLEAEMATIARALGGWAHGDMPADADAQRAEAERKWIEENPEAHAENLRRDAEALEARRAEAEANAASSA